MIRDRAKLVEGKETTREKIKLMEGKEKTREKIKLVEGMEKNRLQRGTNIAYVALLDIDSTRHLMSLCLRIPPMSQ